MRRALASLLATALLMASFASPVGAGHGDDAYVCDENDMAVLRSLTHELFDTPSVECQFRVFYPFKKPHIWSENEYFLGGNIWWLTPEEMAQYDLNRADVIKFLDSIEHRLWWGPRGTPDAKLKEVHLSRGPVVTLDNGWIEQQTYHVFKPQKPGWYRWRYREYIPLLDQTWEATAEVCIEPTTGKSPCPKKGIEYGP